MWPCFNCENFINIFHYHFSENVKFEFNQIHSQNTHFFNVYHSINKYFCEPGLLFFHSFFNACMSGEPFENETNP